MSLHPDRMLRTEGTFDTDNWPTIRRTMILNMESHVLMSIEDIDRLLEGYNPKAQADLRDAEAELRHLESMMNSQDEALKQARDFIRSHKLLFGEIAALAASIESRAHSTLHPDPT